MCFCFGYGSTEKIRRRIQESVAFGGRREGAKIIILVQVRNTWIKLTKTYYLHLNPSGLSLALSFYIRESSQDLYLFDQQNDFSLGTFIFYSIGVLHIARNDYDVIIIMRIIMNRVFPFRHSNRHTAMPLEGASVDDGRPTGSAQWSAQCAQMNVTEAISITAACCSAKTLFHAARIGCPHDVVVSMKARNIFFVLMTNSAEPQKCSQRMPTTLFLLSFVTAEFFLVRDFVASASHFDRSINTPSFQDEFRKAHFNKFWLICLRTFPRLPGISTNYSFQLRLVDSKS